MDYSRLHSIRWWNKERIENAAVMVAGVGAVGNEVVKLLALIGIGRVFLVDLDTIEASNLTRSVLFTQADIGRKKVEVAADKIRQINPDVKTAVFPEDIIWLGLGALSRFDVIFCCFDGYLPRFHLNHHLQYLGVPWVDGGMNARRELNGQIVSYQPSAGAPCFECHRSDKVKVEYYGLDAQLHRWSCAKSEQDAAAEGFVPSTPMMASIVAALQVTEGLRYLIRNSELPPRPGTMQIIETGTPRYLIRTLKKNPTCPQHPAEPITDVYELRGVNSDQTTVRDLLDLLEQYVPGGEIQIELFYDMVADAECDACHELVEVFQPLLVFARKDNPKRYCPKCKGELSAKNYGAAINRQSPFQDRKLTEAGFRRGDILKVNTLENPFDYRFFELTGDIASLLAYR
jgi:adenylyltransferase/sulfurtransferase